MTNQDIGNELKRLGLDRRDKILVIVQSQKALKNCLEWATMRNELTRVQ
ncbi:MAG: hypothetical protein CM15mV90_140 [uncultured marine virus]|nr:MAG: hypothetical protein CM15mV90_140 [uncultured marine virus]